MCYFLSSPDGRNSIHKKEFEATMEYITDNLEKHQPDDGYLDIYFTVVDPKGRFKNLRDFHEMCRCLLARKMLIERVGRLLWTYGGGCACALPVYRVEAVT